VEVIGYIFRVEQKAEHAVCRVISVEKAVWVGDQSIPTGTMKE
jgi:hypothetical protein